MRATESYKQSNVAAGTYGPIILEGGEYQLAVHATTYGTIGLQQMMPDGSTFVALFGQPNTATPTTWVATLAADGILSYNIPPGTYQVVAAAGSGYTFAVTRVPLE